MGRSTIVDMVSERFSRTVGEFQQRSRSDGVKAEPASVTVAKLRDPGYMPRLSWRMGPQSPMDWAGLIAAVASEADIVVFADNSAIDDNTPTEVWDVLMSRVGGLILTGRVVHELVPWAKRRPKHPIVVAAREKNPGLVFRLEPQPGQPGRRTFDYYMALLGVRRHGLEVARRTFVTLNGREPTPEEECQLPDDIQRHLGTRSRLLATKSQGNQTDEELVFQAVEHALTTGRQTLVLTKDADVEEQFFKLLWLIETQYRGMLLADRYVTNFGSFRMRSVPQGILEAPDSPFEPRDAYLLERSDDIRDVLPPRHHFVAISCINASPRSSQLAFGAETEMGRLLRVKDATGGLNTDRLGRRNMHATVSGLKIGGTRDYAAVAYDRRASIGSDGVFVARLDVTHAFLSLERHMSFRPSSSPPLWVPPSDNGSKI